jgi:hypothetical protein
MPDLVGIDSLGPEEIEALKAAIAARENPPPDPVQVLASVCEMLLDKVQAVCDQLDKLQEDFYGKMIGGIQDLYSANMRTMGMKGFGEKYGSLLSPFADQFKTVFGDDLMEKAYDYLEALKGEEGYSDEIGDGKMKELAEQIKGRLAPAAVSVSVEKAGPGPADEGPADGITSDMEDEIARMKAREEARAKARKGA